MIAILYMYFHYQIQLPILQTAEGEKISFLQRSYRVFLCYVKQVDLIRTGYLLTRYSPVQFS